MITPFTADGRVDYEALGRMIDYVIEGGADYIVALGTTAETPTLYIQERAVVAMFIANQIRHRVPLVIGVGGNSTSEVLDQAARVRPARRRRHPERDALLQQTVAGGTLPTLQGRVGTLAAADHPLQHRRPHGRQHDRRDDAAHRRRFSQRHRYQGGVGQHRPDSGDHRPPARRVPRPVGR